MTYTLPVGGKSITSIVSYGGWADGGRDQQAYTVCYSTVTAPATFTAIASVNYNPTLPGAVPSADRVTLVSSTGGAIATNVAAVTFDFLNPAGENGYSGYAEFQIFAATPPTINRPTVSGGNLILTGTGGTPGGSYVWLTSTNLATAIASWTTNTTGTFDGSGAFSNAIPINHAELDRFFLLRAP